MASIIEIIPREPLVFELVQNSLDSTSFIRITTIPLTPTSEGIAGQIAYDNLFMYICTATDTWRRIELDTW